MTSDDDDDVPRRPPPKTPHVPLVDAPEGPDKSAWSDGPWQQEPDRIEWLHRGVPCLMLRHPNVGSWCGYVGVEPGHQWHGCDGTELDVDAHGGITYSGTYFRMLTAPQRFADVWWLGFDCNHAFDFAPGLDAQLRRFRVRRGPAPPYAVYRDAAYVKACVEQLADQIIAAR